MSCAVLGFVCMCYYMLQVSNHITCTMLLFFIRKQPDSTEKDDGKVKLWRWNMKVGNITYVWHHPKFSSLSDMPIVIIEAPFVSNKEVMSFRMRQLPRESEKHREPGSWVSFWKWVRLTGNTWLKTCKVSQDIWRI